jgi:hypothetical protein
MCEQLVLLFEVGLLRIISLVFSRFLIVLGDRFAFSLTSVKKTNDEGGTTTAARLNHQRYERTHATYGVPVTSLPASLEQKVATAYRLRQIALKRKLSCKFERWCKV